MEGSYAQQAESEMWDDIAAQDRAASASVGPTRDRDTRPMSRAQYKYIMDLVQQVELDADHRAWIDERMPSGYLGQNALGEANWENPGRISKRKASVLIDRLKARPKIVKEQREDFPTVPAGRYAVENEENVLRFYVVDRPTEGKWAGFTFLSVMASDEKHPIKGKDAKLAILNKIAVDPKAAMVRYGREIGRCGICNRTLTDPTSRSLGIGPICAGREGWLS